MRRSGQGKKIDRKAHLGGKREFCKVPKKRKDKRESYEINAETNNLYAVFLWIFVNNILVETCQLVDFMI